MSVAGRRILEGARQALAFACGDAAISHDFRETIVQRAQRDQAFRAALIEEARQAERDGDHEAAVEMLSFVAQSARLE